MLKKAKLCSSFYAKYYIYETCVAQDDMFSTWNAALLNVRHNVTSHYDVMIHNGTKSPGIT